MNPKVRQGIYIALAAINVAAIAMAEQHLVSGTNMAICQAVSFGAAMLMKEFFADAKPADPPQLGDGK